LGFAALFAGHGASTGANAGGKIAHLNAKMRNHTMHGAVTIALAGDNSPVHNTPAAKGVLTAKSHTVMRLPVENSEKQTGPNPFAGKNTSSAGSYEACNLQESSSLRLANLCNIRGIKINTTSHRSVRRNHPTS